MPGEFGDEDDVVAGADEAGQAGVALGVGRQLDVGLLAEVAEGEVVCSGGDPLSFQGQKECGPSLWGSLARRASQASKASRTSALSGTWR